MIEQSSSHDRLNLRDRTIRTEIDAIPVMLQNVEARDQNNAHQLASELQEAFRNFDALFEKNKTFSLADERLIEATMQRVSHHLQRAINIFYKLSEKSRLILYRAQDDSVPGSRSIITMILGDMITMLTVLKNRLEKKIDKNVEVREIQDDTTEGVVVNFD